MMYYHSTAPGEDLVANWFTPGMPNILLYLLYILFYKTVTRIILKNTYFSLFFTFFNSNSHTKKTCCKSWTSQRFTGAYCAYCAAWIPPQFFLFPHAYKLTNWLLQGNQMHYFPAKGLTYIPKMCMLSDIRECSLSYGLGVGWRFSHGNGIMR